ncbi:MAG TPA: hypothetical protein VMV79_08415 [Alphaproteobacteria bacterium]|nr:hypothetical protein [Alphaproteobacteria bacterium]
MKISRLFRFLRESLFGRGKRSSKLRLDVLRANPPSASSIGDVLSSPPVIKPTNPPTSPPDKKTDPGREGRELERTSFVPKYEAEFPFRRIMTKKEKEEEEKRKKAEKEAEQKRRQQMLDAHETRRQRLDEIRWAIEQSRLEAERRLLDRGRGQNGRDYSR